MESITLKYYFKILDDFLTKKGLRHSAPRDKLLDFLCDPSNGLMQHFEADTIFFELSKRDLGVSRASVFRNLTLFSEIGILRKSKFGENHFHYELAGTEKKFHHHLICKKCGKFIEFDKGSFKNIARSTAEENGFTMTDYRFEVFGLCPDCGKTEKEE